MSEKWTPEQFWEYVEGLTGDFNAGQMRDMLAERGLSLAAPEPRSCGALMHLVGRLRASAAEDGPQEQKMVMNRAAYSLADFCKTTSSAAERDMPDVEAIAEMLYEAANPTMKWSYLSPSYNHLHAAVRQRFIEAAARFEDKIALQDIPLKELAAHGHGQNRDKSRVEVEAAITERDSPTTAMTASAEPVGVKLNISKEWCLAMADAEEKAGDPDCSAGILATPPSDAAREAIRSALEAELVEAYDCTRVWDAWNVGTMGEDDFTAVTDRLDEIVGTVAAALSAAPVSAWQDSAVVPLEPNEDMFKAARAAYFVEGEGPFYSAYAAIYRAMISAAPSPLPRNERGVEAS